MCYTEAELKSWSYPLSENECEKCLEVLNIIKNECKKLGFKETEAMLEGTENVADYSYSLKKENQSLLLKIIGGYAENTVGAKTSKMTVAAIANDEETARELLENLDTRLIAYGAELSDSVPWCVSFGKVHKGVYLLVGYEAREGICFAKSSGFELCYPLQDADEIKRKTKATDYSFKKQVRLVKTIVALLQAEGEAQDICPMKLEHLMCNLEDSVYKRFDSLSERLAYVVLQLVQLLEQDDKILLEANGLKPLFASSQERERYCACMRTLNKRLI